MSYLSHRCPQTASKLQKVPLHSQGQYAQCPSVPQYIGYQVSADGQSFRPVYLTAEAYEAYLLSQQQEYQRRYVAFNLPPEHNEAQRNPPADPQQEAYPMQPTIQQFQPYYEHPRSVPEQVVQPDYQYPGQQDQAMSRRHTWNHDWNRLSESDHYQASRSSQDLTSDPTNFDSNSHMTFPRYAAEPHACSDTDEMHPSCAFPTDGIGRNNTMFSQRGHGSISPENIGQETVAIASLSEWSNGAEPMRNHSHVDPNSLSLTPKDIDRQHSHEGTATLGCESNPAEMRRGRQRAISSRKCSIATVETRTLSSHPARRRQSLSEHSESKASDDDSTVLSDVDLEAEGITFSPMSMTSIRIEGGKHISTSPRPDRVRGETDQSDSDLEALPEDSDSDYSPVVELRHRRKVAVSQHGPNAQPKRGRVPTKQKERLMLSSPECENVKAQQELCAGNVPVLGRYSPAPMEYSEDTDASTSGRPKKRKRCRRPGEVFKAFVCDVKNCDKRFRRSEHLRRHIRSLHTGEKPFRCEVCLKTFSRSDNLAQHMKVHRGAAKRSFSNASQTVVTTTTSTAANVKARRRRSSPVRP